MTTSAETVRRMVPGLHARLSRKRGREEWGVWATYSDLLVVSAFACLGLMASLILAFSLAIDPTVLAATGG